MAKKSLALIEPLRRRLGVGPGLGRASTGRALVPLASDLGWLPLAARWGAAAAGQWALASYYQPERYC